MKERDVPIESIKTGARVTGILARSVFEEVKPVVKSVMADQMIKVLRVLSRD